MLLLLQSKLGLRLRLRQRLLSTAAAAPLVVARVKSDLVVIGGGSGGLALAREAVKFNKTVTLFDFVEPSPGHGVQWGIGGTCVNVGCIPKKLMHHASLTRHNLSAANLATLGISTPSPAREFSWPVLQQNVKNYIRSLNWGYRVALNKEGIQYVNASAEFVNATTVSATAADGTETLYEAEHFCIATGGRPRLLPDVPGASEHCITSDDLFHLKEGPGSTLVIGASYVALECAGFLQGLGFPTTVLARSIFLRGFDQQMAGHVVDAMKMLGTEFIQGDTPSRIAKTVDGRLEVSFSSAHRAPQVFDTVLVAVGRDPNTHRLSLDKAGVAVHDRDGKILAAENDQTTNPRVFALGDVRHGVPELTPTAIHAGKLLAHRLYQDQHAACMKYSLVPTTVFTPLEYACVGPSEEEALVEVGGEDALEVFHAFYTPLEWELHKEHQPTESCYMKVLCDRRENNRILALHLTGPNAGEVLQGFALAIRLGATWEDFRTQVGIHPTSAEEVVRMDITKRSEVNPRRTGC